MRWCCQNCLSSVQKPPQTWPISPLRKDLQANCREIDASYSWGLIRPCNIRIRFAVSLWLIWWSLDHPFFWTLAVDQKFKSAWKVPTTQCPPIKKIFKIIENGSFLLPYDRYKFVWCDIFNVICGPDWQPLFFQKTCRPWSFSLSRDSEALHTWKRWKYSTLYIYCLSSLLHPKDVV